MSIPITIQGKIIDFPSSAESPNNAEAQIAFAQAVEAALSSAIGSNDVAPQIFNIDAYNSITNLDVPNLLFPVTTVRSFLVEYSIYRATTGAGAQTVYESGTLTAVYNPTNPSSQKWTKSRDYVGISQSVFAISDIGQVNITNTPLTGSSHTGQIVFRARALQSV